MTQNDFLFRWATNLVVMWLLSACTFKQATSITEPANTPVLAPQPTISPAPTQTPARALTLTPTPISFTPNAYRGWLTYTNAKYKFSVRYPSDWTSREIQGTVNTMSGHAVYIEPRSSSLVRLVVGFKHATEDQQITRTGVGAGEIIQRGSVVFLGQAIGRDILVLNGKDLEILYQGSGEIRRADLVFTLNFDYRGNPTDRTTLTPEMETVADKIVASFELVRQ